MVRGVVNKMAKQEEPIAVDGRFEHVVTLENIEEAKTIFPRSELSDLIAQAGERGRKNLLDDDGFYDPDKVASYYLRRLSKDISAYLKEEDETSKGIGIMSGASTRDRRKRIKEAISRNLTTLMMIHVQDMNVELARERLKAYSAKDADYSTIIDMVDNPDKYALNTARGRKSARKSLQSEEYQKLFDKLVPLFQRPAPGPKRRRRAGGGGAKREQPVWVEKYIEIMGTIANDEAQCLKVETDAGIEELREQFKGPQVYLFNNEGVNVLRAKAAGYRFEKARSSFGQDYASRPQALAELDKAVALGNDEARLVRETYDKAMTIAREGEGKRVENMGAVRLLQSIQDRVDVSAEISLFGSLEYAKLLVYKAGRTNLASDLPRKKKLYDEARRILTESLKIEPRFKAAQLYLKRYEEEAELYGSSAEST